MESGISNIVVITGSLSQPRIIKRIISLKNAGFNVKVYGYERNIYDCNALPDNIPLTILGQQSEGRGYLKKIGQLFIDTRKIIYKENHKNVIYYAFGILEAYILNRQSVSYVYEISDIAYGYNKYNIIRPILKSLDKVLVNKSLLTIMTSSGFCDFLFNGIRPNNVIIQPNKLNTSFINVERKNKIFKSVDNLTFAFIGAIRYPNTILRFAKIVGRYFPQHQFYFYGDGSRANQFKEATADLKNVRFFGAFKNPDDLQRIYNSVDIVVACYENKTLNERIAEPNKLYESIFFCKPIVVSSGTLLEKQLNRFHCGFAIDAYSDDAIKHFINNLDSTSLNKISLNDLSIAKETLIDCPSAIIEYLKRQPAINY